MVGSGTFCSMVLECYAEMYWVCGCWYLCAARAVGLIERHRNFCAPEAAQDSFTVWRFEFNPDKIILEGSLYGPLQMILPTRIATP